VITRSVIGGDKLLERRKLVCVVNAGTAAFGARAEEVEGDADDADLGACGLAVRTDTTAARIGERGSFTTSTMPFARSSETSRDNACVWEHR